MQVANQEILTIINNCNTELDRISNLVIGLGTAELSEYVKKYAVIRATGCIEFSFKKIIADKVDENSHVLAKTFINNKIRRSSYNPNFKNIKDVLRAFDHKWDRKFNELISLENKAGIINSLKQLCEWRNSFAHGGHPEIDIDVAIAHFRLGIKIIEVIDKTVNFEFQEDIDDDIDEIEDT